jgi:chorismate--pyruvate lyase
VQQGLAPQAHGRTMHQRVVRLVVGGQVVVLAQSLVPWQGPRQAWPFWRGLGTRSLGSVLFGQPDVQRGVVYYARWSRTPHWLAQALPKPVPNGWGPPWYVRCAPFYRRTGGRPNGQPLWVLEVFLPTLRTLV